MSLIDWDSSLSVGVAEIDEQHKKLVKMINELHEAMLQRRSTEIMKNLLKGLADYTVYHFSTEEKYFDKFGYPDAENHKLQHDAFVNKVSEFQQKYNAGQVSLGVEINQFLKDWLLGHIKGADKAYSSFFNSKGLK